MRKHFLGLFAALALVAGGAKADESAEHQKHEMGELKGTIDTVQTSQNQVLINMEAAQPMALVIDKKTKITLDGKSASLSELKEGQEIRASVEMKGDKHYATAITATSPKGAMAPSGEQGMNELKGTVQSVKTADNQLVLQTEAGQAAMLNVDKDTTIFIDGRTGTLADLKEGQEVRASFDMKGEEKHANWIEVTTMKAPAPEKKEPGTTTPNQPPAQPEPDSKPY